MTANILVVICIRIQNSAGFENKETNQSVP
jgi:hypothetical protein